MLQRGEILNDTYQILGIIGSGGVGTIYKAFHVRLKKEVVIKLFKNSFSDSEEYRKEADILKGLRHSYLPQVYDYVQMNEAIYTVLEYIPGKSLQAYLDEGYIFQIQELYRWFFQLCEALKYLHAQKTPIIHGDIKPANVMIRPDGSICLIDFNVSIEKNQDEVKGISYNYASPEQIRYVNAIKNGEIAEKNWIDERTDIYSLGATFYHLLTYHKPAIQVEQRISIMKYELSYPEAFLEIIQKCMEIDPQLRFRTVTQLQKKIVRMNAQNKSIKQINFFRILTNIVSAFAITIGCYMICYGYCLYNLDKFQTAYDSYVEKIKNIQDADEIIEYSKQLLQHKSANMALNRQLDNYYQIYFNLANAYRSMNDYSKAEEYYLKVLDCNNAEVYKEYAICLIQENKYDEASEVLNWAMRSGMEKGELYYIRGRIAEGVQEYDDAVLQYKKAVSLLNEGEYRMDAIQRIDVLENN